MNYFTKDLREDEELVSFVRQKPVTFVFQLLASVLLIALPFFFLVPLFRRGIWGMLLFGFLILLGIIFALRSILVWYGNCLLVTDQRVIIFNREGLFQQSLSKLDYNEIESISSEIKGPAQTIFGYGNIKIHLESERPTPVVEFGRISDPQRIQELVIRLQKEYQRPKAELEAHLSTFQLMEMARRIKAKIGRENFKMIAEEEEELEGEV